MPMEAIIDFTVNHRLDGKMAYVSYEVVTTGEHEVSVHVCDEENLPIASAVGTGSSVGCSEASKNICKHYDGNTRQMQMLSFL